MFETYFEIILNLLLSPRFFYFFREVSWQNKSGEKRPNRPLQPWPIYLRVALLFRLYGSNPTGATRPEARWDGSHYIAPLLINPLHPRPATLAYSLHSAAALHSFLRALYAPVLTACAKT
jgi:hypothetical protein